MIKGRIYRAYAQKDIQHTRPLYAFVPNDLIKNGKLDIPQYSSKRWDSINCGANKEAIGSHVFPDLAHPISQEELSKNQEISKFLERLKGLTQKSYGKPTSFRKPGYALLNSPESP
jgi:hypothetical protein